MRTRSCRGPLFQTAKGCALVAAMATAQAAHAQAIPKVPKITSLGALPNGGATSYAMGVNGNGSVIVGRGLIQPGGERAFRWTANGGMVNLGLLPGGSKSHAIGVSNNGLAVAGVGDSPQGTGAWHGFRWTTKVPFLIEIGGILTNGHADVRAMSGDGEVIVGYSGTFEGDRAFRWSTTGGIINLGTLPGGTNSYAYGVNGDGSVIVGVSSSASGATCFKWIQGSGMSPLPTPLGAVSAAATGVSKSGDVTVGYSFISPGVSHMVRWLGSTPHDLGTLPGSTSATAWAVGGFDSTIVGASATPAGLRATMWTPELGVVDLNTHLESLGLDLTGWVLQVATDISDDENVIVGDGLFNGAIRAWRVELDPDTDGDGLRDSWEMDGIPYLDSAGDLQYFKLLDADPLHKDLYVEVDAISGFELDFQAVQQVKAAFNAAPVLNPTSSQGIHLHVQHDEFDLPIPSVWATVVDGCWPLDFATVREGHFGTPQEREEPNLVGAKALAYRYCVIADESWPKGYGGCGSMPGDDFVLFMGNLSPKPAVQASAFMHELGHNLGLDHGGGDAVNGKPNYPSIMNYVLAFPYNWCKSFWKLDYSRVGPSAAPNLNENALNETIGIGSASWYYSNYKMPYGVNINDNGETKRALTYVFLDGTPTDFGNPTTSGFQDGLFTTSVFQDLNYAFKVPLGVSLPSKPSPGQTLTAFDDWGHIFLPLQASLGSAATITPVFPKDELEEEAIAWIEANFPEPGGNECYADCDESGGLDIDDFICFQTLFALGDPYADCDGDAGLTIDDFICFQTSFAVGC